MFFFFIMKMLKIFDTKLMYYRNVRIYRKLHILRISKYIIMPEAFSLIQWKISFDVSRFSMMK